MNGRLGRKLTVRHSCVRGRIFDFEQLPSILMRVLEYAMIIPEVQCVLDRGRIGQTQLNGQVIRLPGVFRRGRRRSQKRRFKSKSLIPRDGDAHLLSRTAR